MAVQVVSFQCVLKNRFGRFISETVNHDVLTTPGNSAVLKPLAEALVDLQQGEKRTVVVRAEEAYGFYNPDLVVTRFVSELEGADHFVVGEKVTYYRNGKPRSYRVVEANSYTVTFDGNHPLAGEDLVFELHGMSCREASLDDLADEAELTRFH